MYPTQTDPLGLNGNFFKKLLKSFWPMCLPPLDPKKTGKNVRRDQRAIGVIYIH